jgi:hypothetical protein
MVSLSGKIDAPPFKRDLSDIELNSTRLVGEYHRTILASIGDEIALRSRLNRPRLSMCEKCSEIDTRIARYRWMKIEISDQHTLDVIASMIREMETEKADLHPSRK